ncbi:DNA polymerase IV [Curvibacter sp. AEP1-3]|uniref:DNA polymerase IV n=1 Tax=Curvibacter sp. AEP1-3 TaxID=1844971 RepID=UPI000B3C04A3|nr:DNA polymerase IV [Curvibacter sp. AEP1-3]ARV20693.1 DNA polymerase IV [Curvibacter sp. AEP1-3]
MQAEKSPSSVVRRIAHLDMDAFYASVELLRYPQLKGLPVVIGGGRRHADDALLVKHADTPLHKIPVADFPLLDGYTGRGVITTATYAARQFGVGSAMGLMKAAKLCPQAILLPVDFAQYRHYSQRFKAIITDIAPVMENRGVDEVYIDFTQVPGGQRQGGRVLARLIQKAIFDDTGLTCSVGVAPNKLLAKMASEFNKPNGIAIVHESDLEPMIWPLACRKINGIGPKADEKLKKHGIETIGQLAAKELQWLMDTFGPRTGAWLFAAAHGQDDRPVETESEPVSMSRETTFDRDLHAVRDKAELGAIFTRLCEQVADDLQRKGYRGKTVGIKLRFDDFKSVTRDITVDYFTADAKDIRRIAGLCLKRAPLQKRLRLLGVRVGALLSEDEALEFMKNKPVAHVEYARAATKNIANDPLTGQLF